MKMFASAACLVGWCRLRPGNDLGNGRYTPHSLVTYLILDVLAMPGRWKPYRLLRTNSMSAVLVIQLSISRYSNSILSFMAHLTIPVSLSSLDTKYLPILTEAGHTSSRLRLYHSFR